MILTEQSENTDKFPNTGIIGAGTMGSGIALAFLYQGLSVILQDVSSAMLERAKKYIEHHLERKELGAYKDLLTLTESLEDLHDCSILIEAAPEDLSIKKVIFSQLSVICSPRAILATNTSTLSVAAIGSAVSHPGRVAGMHFFNPAPVLPLVELVAAPMTEPGTIAALRELSRVLGKTPVVARDLPGFIVNRVARPYYGEALRLLGEQVADIETIDRLLEEGAGFQMGPFRLMDLIGIDVNFAAMQSMYEQTSGEPRYRPHWIQSNMVARGSLGRKTGRGFYDYSDGFSLEKAAAEADDDPRTTGVVWVGPGSWAPGLVEALLNHGFIPQPPGATAEPPQAVFLPSSWDEHLIELIQEIEKWDLGNAPVFCQAIDMSLAETASHARHPECLVGFDSLFFRGGSPVTLCRTPGMTPKIKEQSEAVLHTLGCEAIWIEDSPGLILPRVLAMLANEASFAVLEGVADPDTIDVAMKLGVNYPHGPLEWARQIGLGKIVAILDHLRREYGEERYRASTLIRRWAREETQNH
jgi:3-hydroxybutyryl-CoA dehydrogenase